MMILRRLVWGGAGLLAVLLLLNAFAYAAYGTNALWWAVSVYLGQDLNVNNLEHPEDYKTAPPGELGKVERIGRAERPLIFLSAVGFDHSVYRAFFESLTGDFTVWAVTLPGTKDAPAPSMPDSSTSYGERTWTRALEKAVLKLVRDEGLRRPLLVGHFSTASHLALRLALDKPEQFGGVAVISGLPYRYLQDNFGNTLPPEKRVEEIDTMWAGKWFKHVTREQWIDGTWKPGMYSSSIDEAQVLWKKSVEAPIPAMVRYLCEFMTTDIREELKRLSLPVLVVRPGFTEQHLKGSNGRMSRIAFIETWDALRDYSPYLQLETVERAHVFITLDQPEALKELLLDFKKRVGGDESDAEPARPGGSVSGTTRKESR